MALIYIEGFETYETSAGQTITTQLSDRWTLSSTSAWQTVSGRSNGLALANTSGSNPYIQFNTPDTTSGVLGFAFKCSNFPESDLTIATFLESSDTMFSIAVSNPDRFLRLIKYDGSTASTANIGALSTNTWYFIEIKWNIISPGPNNDSATIRLNGATVINTTTNLQNVGSDDEGLTINRTRLNFTTNTNFDDIYMLSTSSGANTDFLGDVEIKPITVLSDGNYSQWEVTGETDHYAAVDDPGDPDDNSTYLSSSTTNQIETFNCNIPNISSDIYGIDLRTHAVAEISSTNYCPLIRIGDTDYEGTSASVPTLNYVWRNQIFELNPADDQAWEASDLENIEFGFKKK